MSAKKLTQGPALGQTLYTEIKAGFVRQNTTFSAWCESHGVKRQNAVTAVLGGWRGAKAQKLVRQIIKAAQIDPQQKAA
mgnify:CR=1 FL=1